MYIGTLQSLTGQKSSATRNQIKPQMRCQSDRASRNDLIAHVTMPRIGSEPRNPDPGTNLKEQSGGTHNDNHVQRSNEPKKILRAKDFFHVAQVSTRYS